MLNGEEHIALVIPAKAGIQGRWGKCGTLKLHVEINPKVPGFPLSRE
jgi:hypothetical protein